jgi:hydrogenase-4 component C
VLQNYLDLIKLMKRQEVVSQQAGWIFRLTPLVSMACMLVAALMIPLLAIQSPAGSAGDLIVLIYLFALPRFFFALAGLDTGSTFASIGVRRELLISALVEPVMLLVAIVMALIAGSSNLDIISREVASGQFPLSMAFWLGMISFGFATYVEMGRLPLDVGEAEQELQEGPLAEYSGPSLAVMKWAIYLKQLVLVAIFFALFLPYGAMTGLTVLGFLAAMVAFLLKALAFYFIVGVLENSMARVRFMKAPSVTWLALGAAVLSFVFYLANV